MRKAQKNNVQVSGKILRVEPLDRNVLVMVGIDDSMTTVPVLIKEKVWNGFKNSFSVEPDSITVTGELNNFWIDKDYGFAIKATDTNSVICFHNILQEYLDESGVRFDGLVKLKSKLDKDSDSSLLIKKMIFETKSKFPVEFEATALRKYAPFFDELYPGSEVMIKADYVPLCKECQHPYYYWKIRSVPMLSLPPTSEILVSEQDDFFPTNKEPA